MTAGTALHLGPPEAKLKTGFSNPRKESKSSTRLLRIELPSSNVERSRLPETLRGCPLLSDKFHLHSVDQDSSHKKEQSTDTCYSMDEP